MDFDDLQRTFFDGLYAYRIPIAIGTVVVAVVLLAVAWRMGWFAAARRHPARAGALLVITLAVGLPIGWYLASPIWIRTELVEPGPVAVVDATASPSPAPTAPPSGPAPTAPAQPTPSPEPTPFVARRVASGSFSGTDEFHFGRGTASIIETAPGTFTLRLEAFSVRNGPDLFVYLSPVADDYADGALELGKLKATDGAFGYELPAGTDPADFASAIIWCKQFSHLFAVAPLAAA
jgi:Electron transfer DM13